MRGKRVLVRVDCNVAVDEESRPLPDADQRLEALLPTLSYLGEHGARTILLSHLGRPGGRSVESLRLDDVARRLSVVLREPVHYVPEVRGSRVERAVERLGEGEFLMLENLRFDPGEEAGDLAFARDLASFGDLFVEDAFAVLHRPHASVACLPTLLPSYAGFLVEREVSVLFAVREHPERPSVAVVGGAKLETKLKLLKNLLPRVDHLLTGGGIANTLLRVSGFPARNVPENGNGEDLKALVAAFRSTLHLPTDVRAIRGQSSPPLLLRVSALEPEDEVFDVGPETVETYCRFISTSKTCVWNGPLGKFEDPRFSAATESLVRCLSGAEAFSVVGGGDTVRAIRAMGDVAAFDHVSTGGGAMLAYLEGAAMPGLMPLYQQAAQ